MRLRQYSTSERINIAGLITSVLFLPLLLLPSEIPAQGYGERPHVGLVLSGGGARGMAHVGVLKVMEEAGLRPDYITGVSIGSIVGGLYSMGYKADSPEKLIKNMNWDLIHQGKQIIPTNLTNTGLNFRVTA